MARIEFILLRHFNAMLLALLLLLHAILINGTANDIIVKLRNEIARSKTSDYDSVIPFLCTILPSSEFIQAANDQDFINSVVYELGFGVLGVKRDSWAAKYQADPHRRLSCFAAMHSIATTDMSKTSIAGLKKLIRRCCLPDNDL
jgi:hypothetical protein